MRAQRHAHSRQSKSMHMCLIRRNMESSSAKGGLVSCTRDRTFTFFPSANAHVGPARSSITLAFEARLTSGPDRRLPGLYRTIVGSSSTFSLRASQRYQPRAVHRSSWPPGFESRVPIHVRPPLLTTTLCPDHGTSERSCTHPACAACGPSTSASHPHRPSPDDAASAP